MRSIVLACFVLAVVRSIDVVPFDKDIVQKIFEQRNPTVFIFTDEKSESADALEALKEFGNTYEENLILTQADKNDGKGQFNRLAEYLGVNVENAPELMYMTSENAKFLYDGENTADGIAEWISSVQSGSATPFLKSHPVPESNNEPVKVVVGSTFNELVLNHDKEVLVKFYAPWCGHCKTLAPQFDKLALQLIGNPNIVIAKVDSTGNEVPGVNIKGFPTLKWWGKDKSAGPKDVNAGRTAEALKKWIQENTEYPWVEGEQVIDAEADEGSDL